MPLRAVGGRPPARRLGAVFCTDQDDLPVQGHGDQPFVRREGETERRASEVEFQERPLAVPIQPPCPGVADRNVTQTVSPDPGRARSDWPAPPW